MYRGSESSRNNNNHVPFHRFLDKCGMTGGKLQLFNGLILITTFFGVRIVYGGFNVRPPIQNSSIVVALNLLATRAEYRLLLHNAINSPSNTNYSILRIWCWERDSQFPELVLVRWQPLIVM